MPQLFKSKASSSKSDNKSAGGSIGPKHSSEQQFQGPPPPLSAFEQQQQQQQHLQQEVVQQQQFRTQLEPQPPVYAHAGSSDQYPPPIHNHTPIDASARASTVQTQQTSDLRQQYRNSYNSTPTAPPAPQPNLAANEHKKGFREKFFGQHRQPVDQAPPEKVSRSSSFRRKNSPSKHASPPEDVHSRKGSAYWSSRQSSQGNLPNFVEENEDESQKRPQQIFNPILVSDSPAVPPKDPVGGQFYPHLQPPPQANQPPLQYPPPPILRVNTDHSTSPQVAYDSYSGSEYSGPGSGQNTGQLGQGFEAQSENYPQHGQAGHPQQQQHQQHQQQNQQHQQYRVQQQHLEQQQSLSHNQQASSGPVAQPYETVAQTAEAAYRNSLQQQQIQAQQQKQYVDSQQGTPRQGSQRQAVQYPPPNQSQYHAHTTQSHHSDQGSVEHFQAPPHPPAYSSQAPEIHQPQAVRGTLQVQQQRKDQSTHLYPAGSLQAQQKQQQNQFGPPSPLAPSQQQGQPDHSAVSPAPPSSSSESLIGSVRSLNHGASQTSAQGQQQAGEMPSKHPHAQTQGADGYQSGQRQHHNGPIPQGSSSSRVRGTEMGRSTPPPALNPDMTEEDLIALYQQLAKDHKELKEKYTKVKKIYFDKEAQVHTLQNSLAHQRLSQSRTSLDDSEYAARFLRLDGLIAQLSFGIRKDWKSIPPWLQPGCNKDAITVGKQEMTAIGKAFISAWLVNEIFDAHFHPDLDRDLSLELKHIQNNVRLFAPHFQSEEEENALWAKIMAWRLTTIEGLQPELRSSQAQENRQSLIDSLNGRLVASLATYLQEPPPADLAGGVPMIIELAVGIAAHLPMESRDVVIEYFTPGTPLNSEVMKLESGIPALKEPMAEPGDSGPGDGASLISTASDLDDGASDDPVKMARQAIEKQMQQQQQHQQASKDKSRGMLAGIMGARKPPTSMPPQQQPGHQHGGGGSQVSLGGVGGGQQQQQQQGQQPPGSSSGTAPSKDDSSGPPKVRIAVGLAVQIRGRRNVLAKASVYSA